MIIDTLKYVSQGYMVGVQSISRKVLRLHISFYIVSSSDETNIYLKNLGSLFVCRFVHYSYHVIYIYKTQSLSVCMSAIEIKLETFRYKQTYESYITFSREAKYSILISIRIVDGGLRAYIYSIYINSHNKIQKNSITNHKQNVRTVYI